MSKNTEITERKQNDSLVGSILIPADFKALDDIINRLGKEDAKLSDAEKSMAMQVIESWNESVTDRIKTNAETAKSVLDFLSGKTIAWNTATDIIDMITEYTGETDEYRAFMSASEKYAEAVTKYNMANSDIIVTDNMTVAQIDDAHLAKQRDLMIANRRKKETYARMTNAAADYVRSLNKDPHIQAAKSKLSAYKRKATLMAAECSDKATQAKINISISNESVRNILHEMMNFAKTV